MIVIQFENKTFGLRRWSWKKLSYEYYSKFKRWYWANDPEELTDDFKFLTTNELKDAYETSKIQ